MDITYSDSKSFAPEALKQLFLSVGWSSGHFPDQLSAALRNYGSVYSAWVGDVLVGLVSTMDDGVMTAYIHYLLVHPDYQGYGIGRELLRHTTEHYKHYLRILLVAYDDERSFYENAGFKMPESKHVMEITSLWT